MQGKTGTAGIENYQALANAIIIRAVEDYRSCLKRMRKAEKMNDTNPDKEILIRFAKAEMRSLKKFFHSDWYKTLTDVDGDTLIIMIEKEFEEKDGKVKTNQNNKSL